MNALKMFCVVCAAGLVLALAGCDKTVKMTFVNGTDLERNVVLNLPYDQVDVGDAMPRGRVSYKAKFKTDDLPTTVSWKAGDITGQLNISKSTPDDMIIPIDKDASFVPMKKGSEQKKTTEKEIKDVPVEQHEVVE